MPLEPIPEPQDMYDAELLPLNGAKRHLMVCCGPRCRTREENEATYRRFAKQIADAGLTEGENKVMLTSIECAGICSDGTCARVLPEDVFYHELQNPQVDAVVNQHLKAGKPVEDYVLER